MSRVEKLARFVGENPGCHVSDVRDFLNVDAAAAWHCLLDAERDGFIESRQPNGSVWEFFKVEDARS